LKYLELVKSGEIKSTTVIPTGAQKSYMDIELNLLSKKEDSTSAFLMVNEQFQKDINSLFRRLNKSYSVAVLDISETDSVR